MERNDLMDSDEKNNDHSFQFGKCIWHQRYSEVCNDAGIRVDWLAKGQRVRGK